MSAGAPPVSLPMPGPHPGRSLPCDPSALTAHRAAGASRWALSLLDFKAHAVDEHGDHPFGVFVALCGHRLLMGELHGRPPGGLCPGCSHAVVQRRVEDYPVRWVRSPGDPRCHVVAYDEAACVTTSGRAQALCGVELPRENLELATQPSSPLCSWCVAGTTAEPPQFGPS